MGDRANIAIRDSFVKDPGPHEAVFLYSHWGGSELPQTLHAALSKRWRWNDESYLARIVLDTMTGRGHGQETGYGISIRMPDNEYDVLYLLGERIYRVPEAHYTEHGFTKLDDLPSISFADYIAKPRTWDNLTD
jgi:hypothetical protein